MNIQPIFAFLFGFITLSAAVATLGGFLGGRLWFMESLSHFRVQYLLILTLALPVLLYYERQMAAAAVGFLAAVNLILVVPFYRPLGSRPASRPLRILMANVLYTNSDYEAVQALVQRLEPDIIILEEVTEQWLMALESLDAHYPYRLKQARDDAYGIAFYSRIRFKKGEIRLLGSRQLPSIYAWFKVNGRRFTLVGMHPPPPLNQRHLLERNEQLAELAAFVQTQKGSVMVIGDLNITPWSPFFTELLTQTGLQDARRGFGLWPTWPSPNLPFMVPLDHCLVSPDIQVHAFQAGPYIGSDHYPIVVDFSLKRRARHLGRVRARAGASKPSAKTGAASNVA